MSLDTLEFYQRLAELLQQRRAFAVAHVVELRGSGPQAVGAKMIVFPEGTFEFTVGGGPFEAMVLRDAVAAIESGVSVCKEYRLTPAELGMHCIGVMRVFIEVHHVYPKLVIFGGGHVGRALGELAGTSRLFHTILIDDRPEYADPARHPKVDQVIATDVEYRAAVPTFDARSYVVIVTRCHATDLMLLKRYVGQPLPYLGMIGSRSKKKDLFGGLEAEGFSAEALARVHSPIGLPIGGKSPAAVAISILAEVVQEANRVSTALPTPDAPAQAK